MPGSVALESHDHSLEHRAVAAYMGFALGSAMGAVVENLTPAQVRAQYGVAGARRDRPFGRVSNDALLSLVLGETILRTGAVEANAVARAFSRWFVDNPASIGKTTKQGIIHFRYSGVPYTMENSRDTDNGACVRTLPVALSTFGVRDEICISIASRDQAHVTHNNPLSDAATECVIGLIHAALERVDKYAIKYGPVHKLLQRFPDFNYFEARREMPSSDIVQTMQAVLQAFFTTDSFEECLLNVVDRGGNTTSTGAIAGMVAGAYYGWEAIPEQWLSKLDNEVLYNCETQARALLLMEYDRAHCASR